jgi:hypothetical protein
VKKSHRWAVEDSTIFHSHGMPWLPGAMVKLHLLFSILPPKFPKRMVYTTYIGAPCENALTEVYNY